VKPARQRINYRSTLVAAGLIALAVIYAALWVMMISNPAERTGADFIAFYAAGRISLTGKFSEVYIPQAQQVVEEEVLGFQITGEEINPFVHPPFILPVLALITLVPYEWAFHLWALILLVLYFTGAFFLIRIISQGRERWTLFASVILFFPVFVSVLNGQDSALLLLGASIWFYGLLDEDDRLAGIGLALTTIRPHIALLLAVPFLFKRRKVWWWFLAGAAGLAVFSVLLIGIKGTENFLHILSISASGEGYKINELAMVNFIGLLRRLIPAISPESAHIAGWIVYALAFVFLCVVWARSEKIREKQIGLAILVTIFAAPHLHYHDLVLLLIPLFCVMIFLERRNLLNLETSALFPLEASWLLVVSNFLPALKFSIPYILGGMLLAALWIPEFGFRGWKKPL
jgi:hypothetical protein